MQANTQERAASAADFIESAPSKFRGVVVRAINGTASPREAIRAACLACVGFESSAVRSCTSGTCPLWTYRPYQDE